MAKEPLIFIDTCSLLETCWNVNRKDNSCHYSAQKQHRFWDIELPALETIGEVIVPYRVYEELYKFKEGKKGPELSGRAKHLLNLILPLVSEERISILGEKNDPFADSTMLFVALKFVTERKLAFITQDRKLAKDLETISSFESIGQTAREIKVRRVGRTGAIEKHRNLYKTSGKKSARIKGTLCQSNASSKRMRKPPATVESAGRLWWED